MRGLPVYSEGVSANPKGTAEADDSAYKHV